MSSALVVALVLGVVFFHLLLGCMLYRECGRRLQKKQGNDLLTPVLMSKKRKDSDMPRRSGSPSGTDSSFRGGLSSGSVPDFPVFYPLHMYTFG